MTRHWLVMETDGEGARAPFVARLAGAGRHLPETHLTTDELMATTRHQHPYRPGTADRYPRAPGVGGRRGFLQSGHLGGA